MKGKFDGWAAVVKTKSKIPLPGWKFCWFANGQKVSNRSKVALVVPPNDVGSMSLMVRATWPGVGWKSRWVTFGKKEGELADCIASKG